MSDIVAMCRAASHDERLSDGMLYRKAAEEIERLEAQLAEADAEATTLLTSLMERWGDAPPGWQPLPDVAGKISQCSNLIAGLLPRADPNYGKDEDEA